MADVFLFPEEEYVLLGKVAKPHGLKGEVKIHAFSDDPHSMLGYQKILLVDQKGKLSPELKVEKSRLQGKAVVYKIESVKDRNDAESIHGMGILIYKEDLQNIEEDEYYWHQFYQLPVHTEDGKYLGIVDSIFSNGAQDIMVIKDGDNEFLIPILSDIIKEHTENGVVITPPPGLLEINAGDYE